MKEQQGRKLIINADGFGITYGINLAIFEAAAAKAITSISVSSNFEPANQILLFHSTFPDISVGVHLNPIVGRPVAKPNEIPTLLNAAGEFWGPRFLMRLKSGYINKDELLLELTKQVEKVLKMGIPVSHLDSHQNSHLHPSFFPTFLNAAKLMSIPRIRAPRHRIHLEYENPIGHATFHYATHPRTAIVHLYTSYLAHMAQQKGLRMADRLISVGHGNGRRKTDGAAWQLIAKNLPVGRNEIYCHPGYPDDELRRYATYVEERKKELSVLLAPGFVTTWSRNNINLISFNEL